MQVSAGAAGTRGIRPVRAEVTEVVSHQASVLGTKVGHLPEHYIHLTAELKNDTCYHLNQRFSKCDPWASRSSVTQELAMEIAFPFQICGIRNARDCQT